MFSNDGTEIVTTALNENIYLFDTNVNFEREYGYKYLAAPRHVRAKKEKVGGWRIWEGSHTRF
jgi:hypothetical protein